MKRMINKANISGYVYQHSLEAKVSGPNSANPGTPFIAGNLDIATDDACINIVTVHFTFCTATTKKGGVNSTYNYLKDIIDGTVKTVMSDGVERAGKVRIDTAIDLNEFYSDRNGTNELVSVKRNEGGFVHPVTTLEDENTRNTFEVDMVITGMIIKEADEERGLPEKGIVKGAIFNFRNELLPVEFSVTNSNAIAYFESLDASAKNPVFTKVKGKEISEVIVRKIVEESAFGEASVREVPNSRKDFVITWAAKEPYLWDDETTITAQELIKAMSDREIHLATLKKRDDDYKASRNQAPAAFATSSAGEFRF